MTVRWFQQVSRVMSPAHPFLVYRSAGVPVVLSTDDEGIERIGIAGAVAVLALRDLVVGHMAPERIFELQIFELRIFEL